jgi:protein SCO1
MNRIMVAGRSRGVCKVGLAGWAIGFVLLGFAVAPAFGQERSNPQQDSIRPQPAAGGTAEQSPAHKYFTDILLVNQNGEKMRFYSDLLQGKVVIINSFFGTCQGSCLPLNRNLEKLQEALGDHVGKDVHIVSISVDPTVDTAASLREYAKKLHARPGWYFLTGDKQNVDFALTKLGQFVSDKQDHLNIIIIGNERTGLWKKAFGLAQSDELVKIVESVLNDQPAGSK